MKIVGSADKVPPGLFRTHSMLCGGLIVERELSGAIVLLRVQIGPRIKHAWAMIITLEVLPRSLSLILIIRVSALFAAAVQE